MTFSVVATVLISQIIVIWYSLGISWVCVASLGTVSGCLVGLFVFWSYTEVKLYLQDLSKVDVSGKCVLITGCDSGFGLLLAESLVKRGMFVFAGVLSLDSTGANNLKSLLLVKVIKMDVTVDEDVKQAFQIVKQHVVHTKTMLWAVVNNAGIARFRMLMFTSPDTVRQLMEVNTFGVLRVSQTFFPLLKGHGRLVNIVSTLGLFVNPFVGAYCASKYAVDAISKALRMEMFALKLPVITINPYGYKTLIFETKEELLGIEELNLYGKKFMFQCKESLNNAVSMVSEKTYEVIDSLESAILNKKFQYSYIPNFRVRLLMHFMKCFSDEYLVKTGCPYFFANIPTTLE